MKKLIYILFAFLSLTTYGQAIFDEGIQLSGNTATAASEKIISQQPGTGELNYIDALNLPVSTATNDALGLKKNATSTAITSTATLTNNGTTFSLSAFTGVIVDNSTVPAGRTVVNFAGASNVTPLYQRTLLYVNSSGTLVQQNGDTGDLTPLQKVENLFIGTLVYSGGLVLAPQLTPNIEYSVDNRLGTLSDFIGNINSGNIVAANGANLQIDKGAGKTFRRGSNFAINRKVPDVTDDDAAIPVPAGINLIGYRNGAGGWTYEAFSGSITPQFWDDGTGVKATVANNKFTNPQVYFFNGTDTYVIYLGQAEYSTLDAAKIAVNVGVAADPATSLASLISTISVEKSCTALNNTSLAFFTQGPKISGGNSSSGTQGAQNMQSVYNNSSTPQITTSTALGAVDIKRGSAADTDKVFRVLNGAGSETFGVTGAGNITAGTYNSYTPANDANVVHLTGAETLIGFKTFNNANTYEDAVKFGGGTNNRYIYAYNDLSGTGFANNPLFVGESIYLNNTDNAVQISTNSVPRFTINNAGNATLTGGITANSFIKTSGTSSQFLKADGSVDATVYAPNNNVVHLSLSETITGVKTFTAQANFNSSSSGTGIGLTQSTSGKGIVSNNNSNGVSVTIENNSTGVGQVINSATASTSDLLQFKKNGTTTSKVDHNGNVTATSFIKSGGLSTEYLKADGSVSTLTNPVTGTGTTNYLPKFTGTSTVGNSSIQQDVNGNITVNGGAGASQIILNKSTGASIALSGSSTNYANIEASNAVNPDLIFYTNGEKVRVTTGGSFLINTTTDNGVDKLQVNGSAKFEGVVRLKMYTVATLPTGTQGDFAYVTDASGYTYNSIPVGGGSGVVPVFFDGTNWRVH